MKDLFPHMPPEREDAAMHIYLKVFGDLSLESWIPQGTILTRFVNRRKLNFAARRSYCSIGFCGHDAIEFYRFSGGECPTGEVTIKIPYDRAWQAGPVTDAIDWYFHN
jgi:hypothetical protein